VVHPAGCEQRDCHRMNLSSPCALTFPPQATEVPEDSPAARLPKRERRFAPIVPGPKKAVAATPRRKRPRSFVYPERKFVQHTGWLKVRMPGSCLPTNTPWCAGA
jgi:hypothetical protein